MPLFCKLSALSTESDVEQKFIYPFLTYESPMGLSLDDSYILTKKRLSRKQIGKGLSQKYYYPDYLISIRGIPVLVVEAKNPNEDLAEAYSEARLYSAEINAGFPHKINVCQFIIVSNGVETWVGHSDHYEPELKLSFDDFNVENSLFVKLLEFCSRSILEVIANEPYIIARGKARFKTPVSYIGGKGIQNEELEENSFGRTFIFENRSVFDPKTEEHRRVIVENAYITSAKREQHTEPMYKEIRKYELPSKKNSIPLATENPEELKTRISQRVKDKVEEYSLMLLVGTVGSGKTTFIRYFKRMFLEKKHKSLAKQCDWFFIDMNMAPFLSDELYSWLKSNFIEQIIKNHKNIDFDSIDTIERIFKSEIRAFKSGIGKLLIGDESAYNKELYILLKECIGDTELYIKSLLSFLKDNYRLLPIVVLDNCDKRSKEEQLLMFQVAQWLRSTFNCVVILPIRDSTYDEYKNEPPLDTVVKDLVFRIDPPDLLKVIQARLDYIVRITNLAESTYVLKNGINVQVKKTELIEYFKCILQAIRGNRMASEIFYRLTDRNTRSGIQIFEDFCKSGHVLAEDIFKIRTADKDYKLPLYKFLNALLRKNRRYYNGEASNFVNLFFSDKNDDFPDPFIRIDILMWLAERLEIEGPAITKGLFPVSLLSKEMQIIGHNICVIRRELCYLIKRGLIFSEALSNCVSGDDLIKITIPGNLHLNLLKNVTYLAACAEDVIFKDVHARTRIAERLIKNSNQSRVIAALNADELVNYLCSYRSEFCSKSEVYVLNSHMSKIYDLSGSKDAVCKWVEEDKNVKSVFEKVKSFINGKHVVVTVTKKSKDSLICIINNDATLKSYLSTLDPKYNLSQSTYNKLKVKDQLDCEVIEYNYKYNNFQLKFKSQHYSI